MQAIFDQTFNNLENAIKVSAKRQAVIAHNIANANTPGYEAMEFDEVLNQAVVRQGEKEVVLEKEMDRLSRNSMDYSSYVKLMSTKLSILRTISSQGKK